jgi:hypothetical protein
MAFTAARLGRKSPARQQQLVEEYWLIAAYAHMGCRHSACCNRGATAHAAELVGGCSIQHALGCCAVEVL